MTNKFSCLHCSKCCKSEKKGISFGLRLFDFEAKILKKRAKELNISADIIPCTTIADKHSNKNIAIFYMFDNTEICPFLKENKCIVYEERPVMCRAFPIIVSGLETREIVRSNACPAVKKLKKKDSKNIKEVIDVYGDVYLYCYLFEYIIKKEKKIVNQLVKKEQITVDRAPNNYKFIDISDYFKINNIQMEDYQEEIKTLKKTKERLKNEILHRTSMV